MEIVRLSSKGQLVLPKNVRERLALKQGLELNVGRRIPAGFSQDHQRNRFFAKGEEYLAN
ncbi:MAG: hypothetical protein STSR0004_22040 [Peptococcaceae bacterium]